MNAVELGASRVDEAIRVVRALGAHRYVAGRLHLIHAFAFAAVPHQPNDPLAAAKTWANGLLSDGLVDPASRDESLWRRGSDAELAAVLEAFWAPEAHSGAAREALRSLLARHGLTAPDHAPFDESVEPDIHPLLVDAGWELLPLSRLDPTRHAGAIGAFPDALAFESASFEEATMIPSPTHLFELPALGPNELLRGTDDAGALVQPLVVWAQGNDTYLDYIFRGIRRAAKL
jgi:hypothetical protein